MKAIIAINNLGWIGKDGKLPWKCSEDLKHFKKLTTGCTLLVGYKTSLNLPPLSDREIVVYDRNRPIEDYLHIDWCIGGKSIYELFCPYFTELHASLINDETVGDVYKPDFDNLPDDCWVNLYHFDNDCNMYKKISRKRDYKLLLKSGMFWEHHPELSGEWKKDKIIINKK